MVTLFYGTLFNSHRKLTSAKKELSPLQYYSTESMTEELTSAKKELSPLQSLHSLQTGDLLLYRTRDLGATFNAVVQGSFYSHVSIIVRGDPAVLEKMYPEDYKNNDDDKRGIAIFEAVEKRGVVLFPIEVRKQHYYQLSANQSK